MSDQLPVYVFNEHNEAFYFWHKARHDGFLSEALDIYHVDAHSDMAQLQQLKTSLYRDSSAKGSYLQYYHRIACEQMNIADFIIPAVLNRLISNVYFIYPQWRKFKPKRSRNNVATAFGEGKVFKHDIKMNEAERQQVLMAYPDLTEYGYFKTDVKGMPARREVILDIDLDYFACTDSITNHMRYDIAITKSQYENKARFLAENESLQYSGLKISFKRKGSAYFATVAFQKEKDRDYFPSREEIQREIHLLTQSLLQKQIKPRAVTICRSCISGYCPPGYFKFIEEELLYELGEAFPGAFIDTEVLR